MCVYVCREGGVRGREMSSNPSLIPVHIFLDRKSRGGDEMQGVEGGNTRAS